MICPHCEEEIDCYPENEFPCDNCDEMITNNELGC